MGNGLLAAVGSGPPLAGRAARWAAVALGCSIPISTAADSILLTALLCLWACAKDLRERLLPAARHPVALAALAFFALHMVSAAYTLADRPEWLESLRKGVAFLLLPVLLTVFHDPRTRALAWRAFSAAMITTLALSCVIWTGWTPTVEWLKGTPANAVVFKFKITHGIFMAFTAALFAVRARYAADVRARLAWAALAAAAAANVLLMVQGRTGQLVLLVLIVFLCLHWGRWRGLVAATVIVAAVAGAAWLAPSSSLANRIQHSLLEYDSLDSARPKATSLSERLYWYRISAGLVAERPILGTGAGGFAAAFAERAPQFPDMYTRNPHNEYLRVAVEFGVPGLALMLFLLILQWRLAARLPEPPDIALARAVVLTIAAASLVSSTWLDHAERLWYVWTTALLFASALAPSRASTPGT